MNYLTTKKSIRMIIELSKEIKELIQGSKLPAKAFLYFPKTQLI